MPPTTTVLWNVGFGSAVITPPLGTPLAGYFHDRFGQRVRDDLRACAAVIEQGDARVALVSLDLICVDDCFVAEAKRRISDEFGIPPDHVLVCATHTHTGPEVREFGAKVQRDMEWLASLPDRILEAVGQAMQRRRPATLRAGTGSSNGYAFNRLYRMSDGTERMGRPKDGKGVLGPAGPVDEEVNTLGAVDEGGNLLGMLVNIGIHSDVIGGGGADFISGDWPGELRRNVAAMYGPETATVFMLGACGDVNHFPDRPTLLPTRGEAKAVQMGRGLAGAAVFAHERAEPMSDATLRAVIVAADIPYYTRTPELFDEIAALKAKPGRTAMEDYFVKAVEAWPHDGQTAKAPMQAIRIGDAAILGIPSQIFTRLALEMKHWSPARRTFVVELANARVSSYVPTAEQTERGAYGSRPIVSRWLSADAGRIMADTVQVMLQGLWREA